MLIALTFAPCVASAQFVPIDPQERLIEIDESQFRQMIFPNSPSQESFEKSMESRLKLQLEAILQAGALTPAQRSKLELAGRGDIHSFIRTVDSMQDEYLGKRLSNQEYMEFHQKTQPLRGEAVALLSTRESLLQKVIPSTLSSEHLAAYTQQQRDRMRRRYRAAVKSTLVLLNTQLPLTADQRTKFEDLILEKTTPSMDWNDEPLQNYFVLYHIAKIPEADLRPIFDEQELKVIQRLQQRGRGYAAALKRQGLLPDSEE
ncbi:hypothetical protein [Planctomicrobium piriforme]|uniref:hypothetical protein n=1 Tax=Planctomicrobium piriforme TaxID=1576369 RepID=UPI0011136CDA|nr:hypothetical protein [Planctomicrobium piriforme]